MPQDRFAITWTKFGEEYGPLTWLTIPGQKILVINSFEAAEELLGKRSSIFFDRPRFTMTNELLGISKHLALSVANDMWKRQRSHLRHALSGTVVKNLYSSLLETKARQYLERCAARPEGILPETTRIIGEAIIEVTYGILEDDQGRDYIQIATRLLDILIFSLQGYVVDMFPALQYLPKWLPGMKFKRDAARWRKEMGDLEDAIFGLATANMLSDNPKVQSSFMFKRIQDLENNHEEGSNLLHLRDDINYCGLQIFFGGLETSEATLQTFIRAMTLFPSVQKKAQAEIDRVIGPSRLPTFKDQPDLPYLHAVMLETLRWSPVVSIGVPRVSRNDDIYDGYFIPKGTTVIANAWGFSRNPKYYTNPSTFDPERFLKQPPELDPREFTFGYGRRLCPGQDLALQKIWIMIASVLWAFKLVGTEDESVPFSDLDLFSFGMANRPMPFKCQLFPRRDNLIDKLAEASV